VHIAVRWRMARQRSEVFFDLRVVIFFCAMQSEEPSVAERNLTVPRIHKTAKLCIMA